MTKNTASGAYPWVQHSKKLYNIDLRDKIFIFLLFKNFLVCLWRFFERNWILRRSHRYHYFFATRPIHTKLISFCCRSSEMHRRENESHSTAHWMKILENSLYYLYPTGLTLYLIYLSDLFKILRCPLSRLLFSTHAVYKYLQWSVSLSPLIHFSVSLSPLAPYTPLYFYLLPFHKNTLMS